MDQDPSADAPQPQEEVEARRSNVTNWLLVGILVVLVAIVAVTFFGNDDPADDAAPNFPVGTDSTTTTIAAGTTTSAGTADTTVPATTTTTEATTTTTVLSTDTTVVLTPEQEAASQTATDWIDALAAGNADQAWGLVAPASQAVIGTRSDFNEVFTGLVEGFGAWAAAEDRAVFVNPVADSGEGSLFVVTLTGTVTQEGFTAQRAAAIPVFIEAGGTARVQPFLRGDLIQFITPIESDPLFGFGDTPQFDVIVPGSPTVLFFVDGTEVSRVILDRSNGVTRATAGAGSSIEPGVHVVTVIYLDEGIQHAEAVLFTFGEGS
ncbi:MAG: hypothetical protein OEO77_11715 [Acidimicrobiia bacterium]|nr:hypothetical protein [Acidimicrobiia bacterium]